MTIPALPADPELKRQQLVYQQAYLKGQRGREARTMFKDVTRQINALTAYLTNKPEPLADTGDTPAPRPLFDLSALLDIPALSRTTPVSALPPSGSTDLPAPLDGTDDTAGLFGLSKNTLYLIGGAVVVGLIAFFFILKK